MKRLLFLCLPLLTECSSAGSQRKSLFHSELNTAVSDLTKTREWERQKRILIRIDIALLGGSKLEYTNYSLEDITRVVRRDKLEVLSLSNRLLGIQRVLGIDEVIFEEEE